MGLIHASVNASSASSAWLSTTSGSSSCKVCPKEKGLATITAEQIWREAKRRVCGNPEEGHAAGALAENREGHRGRIAEEVQQRQAELSGSLEIHATRGTEALGEYANALGVSKGCKSAI